MRMNRAKKNAIIFNKVNGKEYLVTEDGPRVFANEIIQHKPEIICNEEYCLEITENNCICFRVMKDAEPTEPEGYYIQDGMICKNGACVTEQGSIEVQEILCTLPGILVCSTKRNEDNMVDVYAYHISRDLFRRVALRIPEPEVIRLTDKLVAIMYSKTHDEIHEDGSIDIILDCAGILFTDGRTSHEECFDFEITKPIAVDGQTLFFNVFSETKANGDALKEVVPYTLSVTFDDEREDILIRGYNFQADKCRCCPVGGTFLMIQKKFLYTDFFRNGAEHAIAVENKNIVSALREGGYDTVVDLTKKDDIYYLTFASSNYDTRTISIQKTSDRGQIVKFFA